MKKWLKVFVLLLVSLLFLTSCSASKLSYEAPKVNTISYDGKSVPAPVITLNVPAQEPVSHALGLDTPLTPSNIADKLFGSSSPESYPVYTSPSSGTNNSTFQVATSVTAASPDITQMIVCTGSLNMVVNDIPTAITQMTQLANDINGYVVSANKYSNDKIFSGVISIRVPAAQFESVMTSLRSMSVKVTNENISATDVTQEYTDLSSKLKNLQAAETQLLEIMTRAGTVTEVLAVENQLTSTREEIEVTKGRMQYLEQTSAMSLITVNLSQSTLVLNLVAGTRNAKAGDNINFAVNIQGGISPFSYAWDFGDGATSTDESPWHKYSSSGTYTVSVVVTDDSGNKQTDTRDSYITVSPGWSASDVAKGAWQGFLSLLKFLFIILLWAVVLVPFALFIFGIIYLIRRVRRNRKMKVVNTQDKAVKME